MSWSDFERHLNHLSREEKDRIHDAYDLGWKAHGNQQRKSGEPYFTHPIAVAAMLADMGADKDTIIAALLHDTIEDTALTIDEINARYNGTVGNLVEGVTKLSRADLGQNITLNEQIETLRKMFTLMQEDVRVMVIKLIDRLHNMKTAHHLPDARRIALAQETRDVYVNIADRLCMQDVRDELKALCLEILDPEEYEKLRQVKESSDALAEDKLRTMRKELTGRHVPIEDNVVMVTEPKSWTSLRKQSRAEGAAATGVSLLTIVFICPDVDTCYRVMGALHQHWKRETLSFQDFINSPQINGYQGLHTTVILSDGTRVRCKIRTKEMHEYARKGIATICFQNKARGLLDYLPWAERISPLTEDTKDRSKEFWESLQSDILGESIVIHGPGDETAYLPKDASALDGAFYLFKDNALRTAQLLVNGRDVSFSETLQHADALTIVLSKEPTVRREWLNWVHSSLATAHIRTALSTHQTEEEKLLLGKTLLQRLFHERKKGFVEELDERKIEPILQTFGYASLHDVFIAIADGRLQPTTVYDSLFFKTQTPAVRCPVIVQFSYRFDDKDAASRIMDIQKSFSQSARNARMWPWPLWNPQRLFVRQHYMLTPDEQQSMKSAFLSAGQQDLVILQKHLRVPLLLTIVIILWALNPVIAKWILLQGMHPLTLLTIRLVSFGLLSVGFFIGWNFITRQRLARLQNAGSISFLPAVTTFCLATFTYYALQTMSPSLHLTILRLNVLLLPFLVGVVHRCLTKVQILIGIILVCSIGLLFFWPENIPKGGAFFSFLALISYVLYSLTLQRSLQQHKIDVRYPVVLFYSGIFLGITGLVMLLFQEKAAFVTPLTGLAALYVVCCVFIPHTCFYALLKKEKFHRVTDPFVAEIPIAIAAEILLLGIHLDVQTYILITAVLASVVFLRLGSARTPLP